MTKREEIYNHLWNASDQEISEIYEQLIENSNQFKSNVFHNSNTSELEFELDLEEQLYEFEEMNNDQINRIDWSTKSLDEIFPNQEKTSLTNNIINLNRENI